MLQGLWVCRSLCGAERAAAAGSTDTSLLSQGTALGPQCHRHRPRPCAPGCSWALQHLPFAPARAALKCSDALGCGAINCPAAAFILPRGHQEPPRAEGPSAGAPALLSGWAQPVGAGSNNRSCLPRAHTRPRKQRLWQQLGDGEPGKGDRGGNKEERPRSTGLPGKWAYWAGARRNSRGFGWFLLWSHLSSLRALEMLPLAPLAAPDALRPAALWDRSERSRLCPSTRALAWTNTERGR